MSPPLQGANQQGITEHVKVKKKFDALGVGAVSRVGLARPVLGLLEPKPAAPAAAQQRPRRCSSGLAIVKT
jgi:hypothetical protein